MFYWEMDLLFLKLVVKCFVTGKKSSQSKDWSIFLLYFGNEIQRYKNYMKKKVSVAQHNSRLTFLNVESILIRFET